MILGWRSTIQTQEMKYIYGSSCVDWKAGGMSHSVKYLLLHHEALSSGSWVLVPTEEAMCGVCTGDCGQEGPWTWLTHLEKMVSCVFSERDCLIKVNSA